MMMPAELGLIEVDTVMPRAMTAKQRPSFRWSDIWKAPLHDFPIRDEILYQYLPLPPSLDVLEVGPGSGFTAYRLARRVCRLTLVDVAPGTIADLSTTVGRLRNVTLFCADVCKPGLADLVRHQFDAAYALEVLEYLPDPAAAMQNLATVLRPGGELLVQFPNYPPTKTGGVTYFPTRVELDHCLSQAGFLRWTVCALRLRPYAALLYRQFHEIPISAYRRLHRVHHTMSPQTYDQTWTFRSRPRLRPYRLLMHTAWSILSAAMRLGGACFDHTVLADDILNRNLLILAHR